MEKYSTWVTEKDSRINRVIQISGDKSPGANWRQVPNDWGGCSGENISWFDNNSRRIPNFELIKKGLLKDNTQKKYYHKKDKREGRVYNLGDEIGDEYTDQPPLENEPYQEWNENKKTWIVNNVKKEKAENEALISKKKYDINSAEQKIQRSLIAKMSGKATKEDEKYFEMYSAEINTLRNELKEMEE